MERDRPTYAPLELVVQTDFPAASEILVSFPHRWEHLATLRDDGPFYIGAFPADREHPRPDHFPGLTAAINLSLSRHRLYQFFQPRPTSHVLVDRPMAAGRSTVMGTGELHVQLHPIGQAQAWYGGDCAILWECYLYKGYRQGRWVERLAAIWRRVVASLAATTIYTPPHEPTFEEGYADFLAKLGYAPDAECPKWWSRRRGEVRRA